MKVEEMENQSKKRKKKRRLRLPPGMGSVHKIGGDRNRRKPWRARVIGPVDFDEKAGKATQKYITIGYFETEEQAIEALIDYRKNPYSLEASKATFEDVYKAWSGRRYEEISEENKKGYKWAYAKSKQLHQRRMRDLRTHDFEMVMSEVSSGYSMQIRLRTLWNQMCKYAMENDIIEKNYAQFVATKDKMPETTRTAISEEDIEKIWAEADKGNQDAKIAIVFIYTGLRARELLDMEKINVDVPGRIMIGGMKTAAGKNRRIPIHKAILPIVEEFMETEGPWLVCRSGGKPISYSSWYQHHWTPLMETIGAEYTTHYTRHTFATMMAEAGIEEDVRRLILGHAIPGTTARYTHYSNDIILAAIEKLPGRPK